MGKRRLPVDKFGIKGHRIWPKKTTLPVGYTFTSNWGRSWEVIENCGSGRYRIYAEGVYVLRSAKEIKSGQVLHPCDRNVYCVGYLGIGEHTYSENKHRSDCWRAMFKRCYETNNNYLSYAGVEVCEEWHNFQAFATWYDDNYKDGWDLDKDLKSKEGSKLYSPDTCCFLPPKLNKQLSNTYESIPPKEGRKYRARVSFNGKTYEIGRFLCWKNALVAQIICRFSAIEGEIRDIFGEKFVNKYWTPERLYVLISRSVYIAESKI